MSLPLSVICESLEHSAVSRHLELFDQIGHEPITVGRAREVHVTFTLDIDPCGWGSDLLDVLVRLNNRTNWVS